MQEGTLLNNRYQLLQRIGWGGTADVFRARDLMLERYVAVKVLRKDYSNSQSFQDRFRQEARAVANLSHPNIITVHDFGLDRERLFIVMEHVPGSDLKTLLRQRGRFTIDESLPLTVQACAGIGYAHRAGLIHCDVKPQNMLVTPEKRLKVADFGLARVLATIAPGENSKVTLGSPQYCSPEQAAGEAPSPASDVYSLGIVLFEILTGTTPFNSTDPNELMRMHIEDRPVPINTYLPDFPEMLSQILEKVLSKEPSARYRTADHLGRILLQVGTSRINYKESQPKADSNNQPIIDSRPRLKVFLCHSKDDKPKVRKLYHRLFADGFEPWLDEEKLKPGQDWDLEIRKAVRQVDAVVVCLSNSSINKAGYVQKEIRFALDIADEQPEGAIFIIPARLEDCDVPSRLQKWQWVNLFGKKGYEQLKHSLEFRASTLAIRKISS